MNESEQLSYPRDFLVQSHEHEFRGTTPREEADDYVERQLSYKQATGTKRQLLSSIVEECELAQEGKIPNVRQHESLITQLAQAANDRLKELNRADQLSKE